MENDQIVAPGESTNDCQPWITTQTTIPRHESAKDENMYVDKTGDNLYNLYIKLSEVVEASHHPGKEKKVPVGSFFKVLKLKVSCPVMLIALISCKNM